MDFDLTARQARLLDSIDSTIDATGGVARAQELSRYGKYDSELDSALQETIDLSSAGLIERVLIAERLAERGTSTTFGLRALLASELQVPPGPVAITDTFRNGPVRFADVASTVLLIDGEDVFLSQPDTTSIPKIESSYGYPYGQVDRAGYVRTQNVRQGERLGALWRLATSAEIAGNASTAIALTADHLRTRTQFGKPLASLQALRHRLADASVTAEATRWMAREAAFLGESRRFDLVAAYAAQCATTLAPELVQMCGARSFTIEFDMQMYVMRLTGLRLELGGEDNLAAAVLAYTQ